MTNEQPQDLPKYIVLALRDAVSEIHANAADKYPDSDLTEQMSAIMIALSSLLGAAIYYVAGDDEKATENIIKMLSRDLSKFVKHTKEKMTSDKRTLH